MTGMAVFDARALHEADEELADLIGSFSWEAPDVLRDGAVANRCGPIAFAFAVYLRANSQAGGLLHVSGQPAGHPPDTGHYMATSRRWVIDWAYRQFDPAAAVPLVYERTDLDPPPSRPDGVGRPWCDWHPWTAISGELEHDDPLYPDFVDYPDNANPLAYVVAGTDDPEWVTPYDAR